MQRTAVTLVPLALLLLLLAAAHAKDDPAVDFTWKLKPQDYAEYTLSTVTETNGQISLAAQPGRGIGLFGYEVDAKGTWKHEPGQPEDLAGERLLALPAKPVKPGASWKIAQEYPTWPGLNPFGATGEARFAGYEETGGVRLAVLTATLTFAPGKEVKGDPATESNRTVTEGTLAVEQAFDAERGVLVRGRYELTMTQAYNARYKEKIKRESKVELTDSTYTQHLQWDLKSLADLPSIDLGVPVKEAVERAVAFVKGKQEMDGGWDGTYKANYPGGPTALILLALLKGGAGAGEPAIMRGFDYLRKQPFAKTYTVGLTLMALEAKYIPPEEAANAEAFLEGKRSELKTAPRVLSKEDMRWLQEGTDWLARAMTKGGAWGYEGPRTGTGGGGAAAGAWDNSCAQYGVLGLFSAARCGATIKNEVWAAVLEHWVKTQAEEGPAAQLLLRGFGEKDARVLAAAARGWGYGDIAKTPGSTGTAKGGAAAAEPARGSMTCAGIASVCLARARLAAVRALTPGQAREAERSVTDGLAWLAMHYTVKEAPATVGWYYYYLYGLERAGVLAQQRIVGEHDWYREGALTLLSKQTGDGAWANSTVETSFAILFLKRATTPVFSK
ncbi:MAG: hypothetical protein HZA54_01640 [Planctomycetes bacterium]|nr:hypothetical protein [Planctomycetota bacterium]